MARRTVVARLFLLAADVVVARKQSHAHSLTFNGNDGNNQLYARAVSFDVTFNRGDGNDTFLSGLGTTRPTAVQVSTACPVAMVATRSSAEMAMID